MALKKFVVIDTTFAMVDMGGIIVDQLVNSTYKNQLEVQRFTVPGFKDLAAYARRSIDSEAAIVLAAAMPGPEPIDESCAKDASFGIQMVQALTGVSVLELFVHMSEALLDDGAIDEKKLLSLCEGRCRSHADNALAMIFSPAEMLQRAGTGRRQGGADKGAIKE